MTTFALLDHSGMVKVVLEQLERNPDYRLLASAANYLRIQDRNLKRIPACLAKLIQQSRNLFPY
jgi:hypothetical protein